MARLIDGDALEEKGVQFTDTNVYIPIEAVWNAPTVDAVEVVHGEWVDKYEIKSFRHTNIPVVQCSKCECYFCDIINNHHFMYHYCPNCGAKMDK